MNLSTAMNRQGLSISEVALALNTTYATIYRWSKGIHEPGIYEIRKLSEILHCSSDELLGIKSIASAHPNPLEATEAFVEIVSKLLHAAQNIDEPLEIAALVKDIAHNGEANEVSTQQFIKALGEAVLKGLIFLRALPTTLEAQNALRTIERELTSIASLS